MLIRTTLECIQSIWIEYHDILITTIYDTIRPQSFNTYRGLRYIGSPALFWPIREDSFITQIIRISFDEKFRWTKKRNPRGTFRKILSTELYAYQYYNLIHNSRTTDADVDEWSVAASQCISLEGMCRRADRSLDFSKEICNTCFY